MVVVGGEWRDGEFAADLEQALAHPALDVETVVHQFEEIVLGAEDLPPPGCPTPRASRS